MDAYLAVDRNAVYVDPRRRLRGRTPCAPPSCTEPGRGARRAAEHPDPDAARRAHAVVRVTAAPIVPLDLLCASGTSYFGRPGDALRARRAGRRRRRAVRRRCAAGHPGLLRHDAPAWRPGDGSLAERCVVAGRRRRARWTPTSPTPRWPPSGCRRSPRGWSLDRARRLQAGRARARARRRRRGRPGRRSGRPRLLGAGRVVAVCRSAEAQERARRRRRRRGRPARPATSTRSTARFRDALRRAAWTSSSTRCSASRRPRPPGCSPTAAGWSTWAARPATSPSSPRPCCAAGPRRGPRLHEQRADARRSGAAALTAVAEHAAAGRLAVAHEVVPLADVADAWRRQADGRRRRAAGAHALRPTVPAAGDPTGRSRDRRRTPCSWSPRTTSPTWRSSAGRPRGTRAWPSS